MPAALTASSALALVRNLNSFGSGEPRVVIAVSMLTIMMSGWDSTVAMGPNAVAGLARSRAVRSMKWTSPAKPSVMSPAGEGEADGEGGWAGDGEAGSAEEPARG